MQIKTTGAVNVEAFAAKLLEVIDKTVSDVEKEYGAGFVEGVKVKEAAVTFEFEVKGYPEPQTITVNPNDIEGHDEMLVWAVDFEDDVQLSNLEYSVFPEHIKEFITGENRDKKFDEIVSDYSPENLIFEMVTELNGMTIKSFGVLSSDRMVKQVYQDDKLIYEATLTPKEYASSLDSEPA